MSNFDDMRFLRVDAAEGAGEYRLTIFELDPMSEAADAEAIAVGSLADLAVMMAGEGWLDVPVFVADANETNEPDERMLACGTRVVLPPRSTAQETLELALHVNVKPRPAYQDVIPMVTAQRLVNELTSGTMAQGASVNCGNGDVAHIYYHDVDDGLEIRVTNLGRNMRWIFNPFNAEFKRVQPL